MKKFSFQIILLILAIGAGMYYYNISNNTQSPALRGILFPEGEKTFKNLSVNGNILKVEIVDTKDKRTKGLGGRDSLPEEEGMLFVYEKHDKYPFWMKGLKFPLDFVWISGTKVVDIIAGATPPEINQKDEDLPIYLPKVEVDKILEINAGIVEKLGIKIGSEVSISATLSPK